MGGFVDGVGDALEIECNSGGRLLDASHKLLTHGQWVDDPCK